MAIRFFAVAAASIGLISTALAGPLAHRHANNCCPSPCAAPQPVYVAAVAPAPTCGTCTAACSTCAGMPVQTTMRVSRRAARHNVVVVNAMPAYCQTAMMPMVAGTAMPMTAMAHPMTGGVVQAQATTPAPTPTPMPGTPMPGTTVMTGTTMPVMTTTAVTTERRHLFPRLFSRR
jgi:hypothetical protein